MTVESLSRKGAKPALAKNLTSQVKLQIYLFPINPGSQGKHNVHEICNNIPEFFHLSQLRLGEGEGSQHKVVGQNLGYFFPLD